MKLHKKFLNYLGQARVYGVVDIFVFGTALTRDWPSIVGIVILWLSFLFYLESQHKDHLRLVVRQRAWVICFIASLLFLPPWLPFVFGLLGFIYTKKKRSGFFALLSPVCRGLQGVVVAYAFAPYLVVPAFILYALRNLIGDFRDIGDDYQNKTYTLPVLLGFSKNQHWAFYGHAIAVVATTLYWFQYSFLNSALLIPLVLMELLSYPITPRSSNPNYLNFYT